MSTEPISSLRRSNKHSVPRPNEGVWPGLATPPSSPFRARIAEGGTNATMRSLPLGVNDASISSPACSKAAGVRSACSMSLVAIWNTARRDG